MADVTVVTPTIPGREEMLAEAIASVNAQTLRPYDHDIEHDYQFNGPAPTLNKLIAAVETEWYAVLNDDDLWDPDHLEALWAASDDADIVMSWGREPNVRLHGEPPYRGAFSPQDLIARKDTGMRPGCYLARKTVWEQLGGYRDMPIEDWDFVARAAFRRFRFRPVYRETWTYRHHDGQSSRIYEAALNGEHLPDNVYHLGKWLPR